MTAREILASNEQKSAAYWVLGFASASDQLNDGFGGWNETYSAKLALATSVAQQIIHGAHFRESTLVLEMIEFAIESGFTVGKASNANCPEAQA